MTVPAARFVGFSAPYHDGRAFPEGRPPVDETLVAARRPAAHDANRLELVDDLGDGEERGHRAERQAAEIHVRSEEHTSELQSPCNIVCRLLLEKKKQK